MSTPTEFDKELEEIYKAEWINLENFQLLVKQAVDREINQLQTYKMFEMGEPMIEVKDLRQSLWGDK